MPNEIYLDYHATTPVDPRVAELVYHFMVSEFGNASSTEHEYGERAALAINTATKQVADLVGASPREIIWTSGATESINLAILGSLPLDSKTPVKIALSPLEHKAVLDSCNHLARQGKAELIYLQVDQQGRLDLDNLETVCDQGVDLLCVMAANNEIAHILHQYIKTSSMWEQSVRKRAQNNICENSEHHSPLCPANTLHLARADAQSLPAT